MMIFKQHREIQHNIWNYVYFVIHIWHQNRENDSSLELYVRSCIEREDVTWFPSGHTIFRSFATPPNMSNRTANVPSVASLIPTPNNMINDHNINNSNNHHPMNTLNDENEIFQQSLKKKNGNVSNEVENNLMFSSLRHEMEELKLEIRSISDKLIEIKKG